MENSFTPFVCGVSGGGSCDLSMTSTYIPCGRRYRANLRRSSLLADRRRKRQNRPSALPAARGTSGNIASQFFSVFTPPIPGSRRRDGPTANEKPGRRWATRGREPCCPFLMRSRRPPGRQVLSGTRKANGFFVASLKSCSRNEGYPAQLRKVGCRDAGALGMYIFEGFFRTLAGLDNPIVR